MSGPVAVVDHDPVDLADHLLRLPDNCGDPSRPGGSPGVSRSLSPDMGYPGSRHSPVDIEDLGDRRSVAVLGADDADADHIQPSGSGTVT